MNNSTTPVKPSFWSGILKIMKTFLRWLLILVIVSGTIFIYWKYFYTYSEGYRAGLLQKFSSKGAVFKTYEGEMILSSVSSNKDVALASEKFLFTLTNKALIGNLILSREIWSLFTTGRKTVSFSGAGIQSTSLTV